MTIRFDDLPPFAKKLVHVLNCQDPDAYLSGNWKRLDYEYDESPRGITIKIPSVCIGFAFDTDGEFKGIYNWQE